MSLLTSIALALGLSQSPAIILDPITNQVIKIKQNKSIKQTRMKKQSQHFLLPVTKQTFKQNQRKERKASARKKARK
ncbi:MAG: hypothetical protein OCD00_03030 [Colwellia sp.]